MVESLGAKLETLCACHLLKVCQYWTNLAMGEFLLRYSRNKEKEGIDFTVTRDQSPRILLECKSGKSEPTQVLKKYNEIFKSKFFFPVFYKRGFEKNYPAVGIMAKDYEAFFARLV